MLIDSITSPTKKFRPKLSALLLTPKDSQDRFYTPDETPRPELSQPSFAESDSQTPCPVWCHGCGMRKPEGDGVFEEVQCEICRNWSHMSCLPPGVDWEAEDVHFVCKYCLDKDTLADM